MTDMFDLNGKVAVITGGSRGIGRMIAEEFVRRGVRTYITARKAEPCLQTAEELSEFGECIALPQDLSTLDGIEAFANELAERESSLDILINNAGAAWGAEFDEFPESGWDKVMDINVKSPFFLTQKLAPMLRAAASAEQPAKVVNIASIDGLRGGNPSLLYSTSKGAVVNMTRSMAVHHGPAGIRVNCIAPGYVYTPMVMARGMNDELREQRRTNNLLLQEGTGWDVGANAVYLASEQARWVTGVILSVDGGSMAGTLASVTPPRIFEE